MGRKQSRKRAASAIARGLTSRYGLLFLRATAAAFDALVLYLSCVIFIGVTRPGLPNYRLQAEWTMAPAALCSVLLPFFIGRSRPLTLAVCIAKTLLFGIIFISLPAIDIRGLPMVLSYTLVLALSVEAKVMLAMEASWIAFVTIAVFVFPTVNFIERIDTLEGWLFLLCFASFIFCALLARGSYDALKAQRALNDSMRADLERVMDANTEFQEYSSLVESYTLRAERDRLSREIHDSAGYALTTLKMTFEAAKGIKAKAPERLDGVFDEGARLAEQALAEIRQAMRNLRLRREPLPEGMVFVMRLIRNFQTVTQVKVDVDFSNSHLSYGHRIDSLLYKMVQEGLINAYRHGHASTVSMVFHETEGELTVRISDDGSAPKKITKGIGLQGMEERVRSVGGTIRFTPHETGFRIDVKIPLDQVAGAEVEGNHAG